MLNMVTSGVAPPRGRRPIVAKAPGAVQSRGPSMNSQPAPRQTGASSRMLVASTRRGRTTAMTAMLGTPGRCQIRLRRLGGVVYVNLCGRLDERAMTALLQVARPLLTGSTFRRMILDLYDVEDAERLA